MDSKNALTKFLLGDLSRQFVTRRLLPILLGLFFGGIFLSNLWYPTAYDWRYLTISELMNPILNPDGRYFLSTALILCGILLVPVAGYLYRKLRVICLKTAKAGKLFMLMGTVGLVFLGIIPDTDELDPYHQAAAATVACGFIFSFLCIFLITRKKKQKEQFNQQFLFTGKTIIWFAIIGMLLSQTIRMVLQGDVSYTGIAWMTLGLPSILSIALWEWEFFLSFVVVIGLILLAIPDAVERHP